MNLSNAKSSKFEAPFSIKILDDDFNLVTPISYDNLQWDRKYNGVGQFVIEGVQGNYDRETWKYVYTEKRKELGRISQVNVKKEEDRKTLTLSGLFVENELNDMICYKKPTHFDDDAGTHYGTSVLSTDAPTWIVQEGTADAVAVAFFNAFKQISFRNYLVGDFAGTQLVTMSKALDIFLGTVAQGVYKDAKHTRNNERLGDKLYNILEPSGASYEVIFDYDQKTKTLNVIHGVDRRQGSHEYGVNPCTFSMSNGTIKSASIVTSNTETKDAVIQTAEINDETIVLINALSDMVGRFTVESMNSSQSDFINDNVQDKAAGDKAHKLAVMADASQILLNNQDILNVQFDFVKSSYRYMIDYDLGDMVSVDIPEIGISLDTQITACHEVIQGGAWNMQIEVGKTILRKRGKI